MLGNTTGNFKHTLTADGKGWMAEKETTVDPMGHTVGDKATGYNASPQTGFLNNDQISGPKHKRGGSNLISNNSQGSNNNTIGRGSDVGSNKNAPAMRNTSFVSAGMNTFGAKTVTETAEG